jgi:hypothetical protein
MVISLAVAAVFFVGTLAAWGSLGVDEFKAPRSLVHEAGARQTDRDIRNIISRVWFFTAVARCTY